MKRKVDMSEEAVKARIDKYIKSPQWKESIRKMFEEPRWDLLPCENCGRIVYVGKCCSNPKYQVVYYDKEGNIIDEKETEE